MQEISGYIRIIPRLFTHSTSSDLLTGVSIIEMKILISATIRGAFRYDWIGLSG